MGETGSADDCTGEIVMSKPAVHLTEPPRSYPELRRFEHGPFRFREPDLYDRHLMFDTGVDAPRASARQRFEALARSVRDVLMQRWVLTKQAHEAANPKQVYYLSMEFLIGRSLANNVINMGVESFVREDLQSDHQDWLALAEEEHDAGLGNGGLGRLAACFVDSLATLDLPAVGYGLRYEYGMFKQTIEGGWQHERPDNWLRQPDPWEVHRPTYQQRVEFATATVPRGGEIVLAPGHPMSLIGTPFDRPVVGYGGKTVNTLRLWSASSPDDFDLGEFNGGDFFGAVSDRVMAESLTRVLYPDDSRPQGRSLRFMQECFLVCCSLGDIIGRFRRRGNAWQALPDKVAIQLNDTHPAIAVAELMRILLDQASLPWDEAWDLTVRTLAYTNHTLLPEALEKWPVELFEALLPRHLQIIYEINKRLLEEVRTRLGDGRAGELSIIEEQPVRSVRMAHLAIAGSHSTNGVSELHSELVRTRLVPGFAALYPGRFNNKTNGVTPRRWLLMANPPLARAITSALGDRWISHLDELAGLRPLAADPAFREAFLRAKRQAKDACAAWLAKTFGVAVDPASIFDCQIKRVHEYKRQILDVLHILHFYRLVREGRAGDAPPRTFILAGKAAPAYELAKLVIKLIHNVAARIDADPAARGRLKVLFLPDYGVGMAERLIPAADISEQISTAGFEASGTSNMKFMMNGALTVGTRDGATVEMAREVGEENFFLFGLTAAEVAGSRGWYDPMWHYHREPEVRAAIDLLFSDELTPGEAGIFEPIRRRLLGADQYMHLADLRSYLQAHERAGQAYRDPATWAGKAILNVAASGRFSSDRTIREYARDIWRAEPCPLPE
jgi:starch phosphorylase